VTSLTLAGVAVAVGLWGRHKGTDGHREPVTALAP
jgi:hypothetical protein